MTRKVMALLVFAIVAVAVLAVSTQAGSYADQYSFKSVAPDKGAPGNAVTSGRGSTGMSLGAMTADGGSPGEIIGRTYRDDQGYANPGRRVDWYNYPQVHHIFGAQMLPGEGAGISRWAEYTVFDPTTSPLGVFLTNVWLQPSPLTFGGFRPQLTMDTSGHAVIACETFDPAVTADPYLGSVYYDVSGPGIWGTFLYSSIDDNLSANVGESNEFPKVDWQLHDGQEVTHMICYEQDPADPANGFDHLTYWRKVGAGVTGTWTSAVMFDSLVRPTATVTASRTNGNVAIACAEFVHESDAAQIYYVESTDMGATWGDTVGVVPWDENEEGWMGWLEACGLYDDQGYLHMAWYANEYVPPGGAVGRGARIFHWSNRPGADQIALVHIADFNPGVLCGVGGYATLNVAKVVLSQCNDRMYCIWNQYGYPARGDTSDCADPAVIDQWNAYNAEVYLSVSLTRDGLLWDAARNLTNTRTPDCDGTDENNCDSDTYATMARYGMNTASFGETYWGAVPAAFLVRDVLDPDFPDDGWYLDLQYINDLMPDEARRGQFNGDDALWTYNPVKWVRLPCVDPIIEPRINISQDDFNHPVYWIKSSTPYDLDLEIENIGNATLEVTGFTKNEIQGPTDWLTINTTTMTIGPASSDIASLSIASITPPAGTATAIQAEVIIHSNDTTTGDYTYFINTVVADTVAQVVWDTISTTTTPGSGVSLTISTHGNAGNVGIGEVNLDFVNSGDCDEEQTVYLYDLCPVIMQSADIYSWQVFWQTTRTDTFNFQPIVDTIPPSHVVTDDYEVFGSGTFVTNDTVIACNKYWIAPKNDASYVLERWDLYPFDGVSTVTGVAVGEWIDWDIPTATPSNNEGGVVTSDVGTDYAWQKGIVDLAAEPPPCLAEERRWGASGLLGYFTTSEYGDNPDVNHDTLFGGFVQLDEDIFAGASDDSFLPDSAWAFINRNDYVANNSEEGDQQVWLSFGTFDLQPGDPLHIWIVHAAVYDGEDFDLQAVIDDAEAWYFAHRDDFHGTGCCGTIPDESGKYPAGYSGNANCSEDGKRTLSDVSRLIDHLYISKAALCCYAAGNTNGSLDWNETLQINECKITLSDVSRLIDALYISKALVAECQSVCER